MHDLEFLEIFSRHSVGKRQQVIFFFYRDLFHMCFRPYFSCRGRLPQSACDEKSCNRAQPRENIASPVFR